VTARLRVVVADDHPMVRYGVAAVLADVPDVELAGEATDGAELLRLVADRGSGGITVTELARDQPAHAEADPGPRCSIADVTHTATRRRRCPR